VSDQLKGGPGLRDENRAGAGTARCSACGLMSVQVSRAAAALIALILRFERQLQFSS
jgi:hypothetical protein